MSWRREQIWGLAQHLGMAVILVVFVLEVLRLAGLVSVRWPL